MTTAILCGLLVVPVLAAHLRRALTRAPLHLIEAEQSSYRNASVFTIGVMLALAVLATVSPLFWAASACVVGVVGLRIGSRLHLVRPLVARISCVPEADPGDLDGSDTAPLRCVSGDVHLVPEPVAVLMTPRTLSRTDLRDLPYTLVGGAHESLIGDAEAFLRLARECGCLTFEPADYDTDTSDDTTPTDTTERAAS